jgi:phosphoglycerol transferase MdoB-like AlkP superfamily enzyme
MPNADVLAPPSFLQTILRQGASGALRALVYAWLLVLPLVLVLCLVRWGQLVYFWPSDFSSSTADIAAALWQGLRFDLKVAAIAGFLLLPVLPWGSGAWQLCFGRILVTVVGGAFVLLSLTNLHYFGFYKTPIDSLVFGLAEDDTQAVLHTIWRDFPVLWTLLLAAVLTAGLVIVHRYGLLRLQTRAPMQSRAWGWQLLLAAALLLALVFAGKGTLREMALQRQHLTVTTSQFLNDMVPNGVIALKYAWDSRRESQNLQDPLLAIKSMGFDSPLAAAQVLGLPRQSEAQLLAALTGHTETPATKAATATATSARKNLVFFLMESWSAEPLRYQAPQFDVLGRLAPTLSKACHFRNFDSAQPGTHPSLEAILFSSPISPLTLGEVGRKLIPWAVPRVMKEAGYHTVFVTSVRTGWRELNRVLKVQGFDEVVDASTLQELYPEARLGIWGVWDHYVFQYLSQRMAKSGSGKPLFVFVLTATNHPPYDLPDDYVRKRLDMALWKGETTSDTLRQNLDTYRYATDLLGGFVQEIQNGPRAKTTLVAATGDHNVRSFGMYAEPSRRYLMRQVPFMIWNDGLDCGPQQDLPASHRDMFPTLLPLVGVNGGYVHSGRNLLQAANPADPLQAPRALFFNGEARNSQGMWQLGKKDSFVCTSSNPQTACQFNALDDQQERARYALLDWHVRASLKK